MWRRYASWESLRDKDCETQVARGILDAAGHRGTGQPVAEPRSAEVKARQTADTCASGIARARDRCAMAMPSPWREPKKSRMRSMAVAVTPPAIGWPRRSWSVRPRSSWWSGRRGRLQGRWRGVRPCRCAAEMRALRRPPGGATASGTMRSTGTVRGSPPTSVVATQIRGWRRSVSRRLKPALRMVASSSGSHRGGSSRARGRRRLYTERFRCHFAPVRT